MTSNNKIINETEQKLVKYFHDIKEIQWLKTKLQKLENRKKQVEEDIKNSNISLCADENLSVDYSKENIRCQPTCKSPIERKIETAFKKLDNEKDHICSEIIEIKITVREIEESIEKIEFILNLLEEDKRKLIKMKYDEKRNYIFISSELHISKSTINRAKESILYDISKYMCTFF